MGTEIPDLSNTISNKEQRKNFVVKEEKKDNKILYLVSIVAVLALGVFTGYYLSKKLHKTSSTTAGQVNYTKENISKGQEYGIKDITGKDTATGVIETGGLDGEGTHRLIREGGPSQTVYLTSSVLDLEQFTGKKVQLWGETFRGQKAGWFMDVLKIKPL